MRGTRFVWALLAVASVSSSLATAGDWAGFMNVWSAEPPTSGTGAYVFGSGWGVSDLKTVVVNGSGTGATITDNVLDLYPNYNAYADNPGNAFWRNNGGAGPRGNKWMEANTYVESTVATDTAVFSGTVSAYSLASEFRAQAFIKLFDTNYNLVGTQSQPLTGQGNFSLSLDTFFYQGYRVQSGFMVSGTNANPAAALANGSLQVITQPRKRDSHQRRVGHDPYAGPGWISVDPSRDCGHQDRLRHGGLRRCQPLHRAHEHQRRNAAGFQHRRPDRQPGDHQRWGNAGNHRGESHEPGQCHRGRGRGDDAAE